MPPIWTALLAAFKQDRGFLFALALLYFGLDLYTKQLTVQGELLKEVAQDTREMKQDMKTLTNKLHDQEIRMGQIEIRQEISKERRK